MQLDDGRGRGRVLRFSELRAMANERAKKIDYTKREIAWPF